MASLSQVRRQPLARLGEGDREAEGLHGGQGVGRIGTGGSLARSGGVRLAHLRVASVIPALRALVARKPGPLDLHWFEWVNRRRTHPLLDWLLPRLTLLGLGGIQLPAVGLVWWLHRASAAGRALWSQSLLVFALTTLAVHAVKRRV